MREDVQNRLGKEWTQIQEECLWEDREEWKRLCDKMTGCGGHVSG
jgi:hypothetical protein